MTGIHNTSRCCSIQGTHTKCHLRSIERDTHYLSCMDLCRHVNLIARKLADNRPVILASDQFIKEYGEPKKPADLVKLPAIFFADDGLVVNRIPIGQDPKSGESELWEFQGRYRVNEPELILDAVQSGLGFGILGLYMLDRNVKEPGLVSLLTGYKLPNFMGSIYAVYPHRNPTPLVNKFIEMIKEEFGEIPVWESYIDDVSSCYK